MRNAIKMACYLEKTPLSLKRSLRPRFFSLIVVAVLAFASGYAEKPQKVTYRFEFVTANVTTPTGNFLQGITLSCFTPCTAPLPGSGNASRTDPTVMTIKLNGLTLDFSTGLLTSPPTPATALTAQFDGSDGVKITFVDPFFGLVGESTFAVISGEIKPKGGKGLKVLGTISTFRIASTPNTLASSGSASADLRFFWPEQGGVFQVFMEGTFTLN